MSVSLSIVVFVNELNDIWTYRHILVGVDMIKALLRQYGTACSENFTIIRRQLHGLSSRAGGVGLAARDLFKQIPAL
jgi:hypothetical protein